MNLEPGMASRLQFLVRVIRRECSHLLFTDDRLFERSDAAGVVERIGADDTLGERVEAFVGRFCRLQDSIGDKLLPLLLAALGEKPSSFVDNLDRAERLGLVESSDEWMFLRNLRNKMVHEYVEDPAILADALQTGHAFVPKLIGTAEKMIEEIVHRGWA